MPGIFIPRGISAWFLLEKECLLRCLTPHAWENWIYENIHSDYCLVYRESHWNIFWENFPRWNFDPDFKMSDCLNYHVFGSHSQQFLPWFPCSRVIFHYLTTETLLAGEMESYTVKIMTLWKLYVNRWTKIKLQLEQCGRRFYSFIVYKFYSSFCPCKPFGFFKVLIVGIMLTSENQNYLCAKATSFLMISESSPRVNPTFNISN